MRTDPLDNIAPVLPVPPAIDNVALVNRYLMMAEEGHLALTSPTVVEIVIEILNKVMEKKILLTTFKLQGLSEESLARLVPVLTKLLPLQANLEELDLSKNSWGKLPVNQFLSLVTALKFCKKLHSFYLSGAALSLDHARILSMILAAFPALENVIVGKNLFNEEAVSLLLLNLKMKSFNTLSLSNNPLGPKGAAAVAKWLGTAPSSFHTLYLSHCGLKTAGLQALEAAINNVAMVNAIKFQGLCLDENQLDDQSIPLLLKIVDKQPQLRDLQINNNAFTRAGLTELQQGVLAKFDVLNKDLKESLKKELKAYWLLQTQSPALSLLTQLELWESILALYPYDEKAKAKKTELLLTLKNSLNEFNQALDKQYQHEMREGKLSDWNQPFQELVPTSHKTLKELWTSELDFLNVMQGVRSKVLGLDPRVAWRLFEKLEDVLTLFWPLGRLTALTRQNFATQISDLSTALQAPTFLQHYASLLRYSVQYPMIDAALKNDFMAIILASSDLVSEKQPYQVLLNQWINGEGLLMAPIQRLMRYELLVKDLLKACQAEAKPGEPHPAEQVLNSLVAQIGRYALCSKNKRIQADTPLKTIVELLRSSQLPPNAIGLPVLTKLSLAGWMSPTRTSEQLMKEATARDPHATLTPQIELKMGNNEFILLDSLTEREVRELFKQEGLFIAIPLGQKTVSARLGNGYFGELSLAKYHDQFVAVKKITDPQRKADSEREDYIHKQLNGISSIIPFYGSTESGGVRYTLMALGGLGNGETLRKRLANQLANGQLSRQEALKIVVTLARSLLQGLSEMHSKARICHLDLKPENLVLNGEGQFYIIDFGCARSFVGNNSRLSEYQMADQRYFSPQRFIQHHEYKHRQPLSVFDMCKEDSWAAGVCLWEILQNEDWLPTSVALNLAAAPVLPLAGWKDFISHKSMASEPVELWDLIRQLLTFDEGQRPTCEAMLNHPVFHKAAFQFASPQEAKAALRALEERERLPVGMNPGKEEEDNPASSFVAAPVSVSYLHDDNLDLNAISPPHQPILVSSVVQWVDNNNNNNNIERVQNNFQNSSIMIQKLLDTIGKESNDNKQLGNINITREEVSYTISNKNNYYTADFINLLLHNFNQETLPIQVYPAITVEQVLGYFEQVNLSDKDYHFIPLNVAYDENEPQHKNHWTALIIDKKHQLIFYLDPAQKQVIPAQVEALKTNLGYQCGIILNPIDFQQKEKQEGWIRHCGAYLIEMFKSFRKYIKQGQCISGSLLPNTNIAINSISLQTALSDIPCGEAEVVVKIRDDHVKDACNVLAVNLENLSESPNTQFERSENLREHLEHVPKKIPTHYMNDEEDTLPTERHPEASDSKIRASKYPIQQISGNQHRFWLDSDYVIKEDASVPMESPVKDSIATVEKKEDKEVKPTNTPIDSAHVPLRLNKS